MWLVTFNYGDDYGIHVCVDKAAAFEAAVAEVREWINGDWDPYGRNEVAALRVAHEARDLEGFLDAWNNMSTTRLDATEEWGVETTDGDVRMDWPEDDDD